MTEPIQIGSTGAGSTPPLLGSFTQMSAALTGFTEDVIAPPLDTLNLVQEYFQTATLKAGDTLVQLLEQYQTLSGQSPQDIANTLLGAGSTTPTPLNLLARSILKLWYLGTWYPFEPSQTLEVVSANAYTSGLAWQVAQAHPMGYSELTFGYWQNQPAASLADLGANVPTSEGTQGGNNG